jgi:uncharacterized membrane protein YkvA (DUF1232 family)
MMAELSDEAKVRRDFWPKLKSSLARIPFAEEVVAAYYCAMDSQTPLRARGIIFGALAYFIMPFDVIPDFILGIGFTDDMAVVVAAIAAIRSHMRPEHRDKAKATLEKMKAETISA